MLRRTRYRGPEAPHSAFLLLGRVLLEGAQVPAGEPGLRVDRVADRRETRALGEAYLQFLFQPAAQAMAAQRYFRPSDPDVLAANADSFPTMTLTRAEDVFGDWANAQRTQFAEGGVFDQIMASRT